MPGLFIGLQDFLRVCCQAVLEDGPEATVLHAHTRKQEPRTGRIEIAPGIWCRVLGRNAQSGGLICESRAQDLIDAHWDGRLRHKDPPAQRTPKR